MNPIVQITALALVQVAMLVVVTHLGKVGRIGYGTQCGVAAVTDLVLAAVSALLGFWVFAVPLAVVGLYLAGRWWKAARSGREVARVKDVQHLATRSHWYGYLTVENAEAVADRIRLLIGDGQRYTWVATNEESGLRPQVRTSQVAREIHVEDGHVWVNDSYGLWGILTGAADREAAQRLPVDSNDLVRLHFAPDSLEIQHRAPAGVRLFWVIALENMSPSPIPSPVGGGS